MSVTVIDRPQKNILDDNNDIILNSLYNASGGELPTQYSLSNTLSPFNTIDSSYDVDVVTDISGRLHLQLDDDTFDDKYNVDAWITVTTFQGLIFIGQIVTIVDDLVQTTIPYDPIFETGTNTFVWFAKDYEVLVNAYVGLNPNHISEAEQPSKLIAQKSITSFVYDSDLLLNTGTVNVTGLIKSVIDAEFKDIITTELNLNQYTQFRIEFAEVYKRINPTTLSNELYDGTNYQSEWTLGQPTFIEDEFSCSGAALLNEEFATDLNDWTNFSPNASNIDWLWDLGNAKAQTFPAASTYATKYLEQPFSYVANAQYNIKAEVFGQGTFTFNIYLKNSVTGEILPFYRRNIVDGALYVIDYNFKASMFFGFFPDTISFRATNGENINNNIEVSYFRQTQANDGCLPYLSSTYSVRQFGAKYGGSMGDYEGDISKKGKFLTYFQTKVLNASDIYPEISLIANNNATSSRVTTVRATVTYSNDEVVDYYADSANQGEGVYRVILTSIITSIQSQIDTGLLVRDIDLVGVSSVQNMLSDLGEGTFENGLPNQLDNISTVSLFSDTVDFPHTGIYSGLFENVNSFTSLGNAGAITFTSISLRAGQTYVFSGYVYINQEDGASHTHYVDDPDNLTYIQLIITDLTDTIITTDVVYDKIYGNVTSYRKTIATYTPASDIDVKVGVYKGVVTPSASSIGARGVYFDDLKFEGPEIEITDSIKAIYTPDIECNSVNMKWLNDLGGWESYVFTGRTSTEIIVNDNKRYEAPVFGDWSNNFTSTTGIGFEQSVEYGKVMTVSTKVIGTELKKSLSTIKTSIHVLMYSNDLNKYITVLVDKSSFIFVKDSETSYNFEFDVMLPKNFVQTA